MTDLNILIVEGNDPKNNEFFVPFIESIDLKAESLNIFKEIELIKEEKKELLIDYNNLQYKIIHDLNKESDFKKYKEKQIKINA